MPFLFNFQVTIQSRYCYRFHFTREGTDREVKNVAVQGFSNSLTTELIQKPSLSNSTPHTVFKKNNFFQKKKKKKKRERERERERNNNFQLYLNTQTSPNFSFPDCFAESLHGHIWSSRENTKAQENKERSNEKALKITSSLSVLLKWRPAS